MKLPGFRTLLPNRERKQDKEYFLALELGEKIIKVAVWEEDERVFVRALAKGETVEEAIEKVKEKIPEDLKIEKVIFGLPPHFVFEDKIKAEHLGKLKEITRKFSLSPLGFVITPEAITHLLEVEEETPQTALLVAISSKKLTFSLFRGGQSKKTAEVKRSRKIYHDFEQGLLKFVQEEVLPAKIILYDEEEELSEIKEELLSYPWQKNERFLHVPKIEVLPWGFSLKAIVEAGVSEMKKKDVHLIIEEEEKSPTLEKGEDLGFIAEKDIAEEGKEKKLEVAREKTQAERSLTRKFTLPSLKLAKLPPLPPLPLPEIRIPQFRWSVLAIAILFLVIFGGIALSAFYFYPRAKIKIIVDPQILGKQIELTLNPQIASPNIENKEIPGKVHAVKVEGEKTSATSGKKIIGEPAQGEVTLYNKTMSNKSFSKGTVLVGPNNLRFSLDEEVMVASVSDVVTGTPGTSKVKVSAERIGPLGNLKAGSNFTIDDFPLTSYAGRNEVDFSGGTEREVTVVSSEDQEKLLSELSNQLKNEAKEKLKGEISPGEEFLEESLKENVVEKVFDKEVREEGDNLSLKLVLEVSQTSFKEEHFDQFLKSYLLEQIPPDFEFYWEKSSYEVKSSEVKEGGKVLFSAYYKAYLLPKIDLMNLKGKIAGKSLEELEKELKSLSEKGVIGYEIISSRRLPLFKDKLPIWRKNIEMEINPY